MDWQRWADVARRLRIRLVGLGPDADLGFYATRYERHARVHDDASSVGRGDFDLVGQVELGLLQQEGLEPSHTLVDIGCGVGRLAKFAVPYLASGAYVGSDLSPTMLVRARARIGAGPTSASAPPQFLQQRTQALPLPSESADVLCAFSVFTHVEHEDAYQQLRDALRVCRPGGRLLFSCLPLELELAKEIFRASARRNVQARWWIGPRNVVTSRALMGEIASLAGWRVRRWYAGDEANIAHPESGELHALGQSTCVLEKS